MNVAEINGRLLRIKEVETVVGKKKSSIYADETFPRPIKIGPRASAWVGAEVAQWIEHRIEVSRKAA